MLAVLCLTLLPSAAAYAISPCASGTASPHRARPVFAAALEVAEEVCNLDDVACECALAKEPRIKKNARADGPCFARAR